MFVRKQRLCVDNVLNNFGYFLDYDNLFNNILYENKDKRINIDNLSEAFNQISNTANSNIFKDVFDEIDLISPKLVKVNDEKEELLYYLMEIISKFGYNQEKSIKTLFDRRQIGRASCRERV